MNENGIDKKYKKILKNKSMHNESLLIMLLRLKESLEKFNKESSRQTKWIIWLTIAMLVGVATQIGLLIFQILRTF